MEVIQRCVSIDLLSLKCVLLNCVYSAERSELDRKKKTIMAM